MTPTPDTKKIAAEMRKRLGEFVMPTHSEIAAWADALDPVPGMGIQEAIEVLREQFDHLGNGKTKDAIRALVAHYEATTKAEAAPVHWNSEGEGELVRAAPGTKAEKPDERCPYYWGEHDNRCLRNDGHPGDHKFSVRP